MLLRNLTVTGISMDVMDEEQPGTVAMINDAVQRPLDEGHRPRYRSLEQGAEALRIVERRKALGKIVVGAC